jgi:glutamyl-tRNA synthetase
MVVRTRFAPSPTGFLHIGGARTALYSWLYAKSHEGQFILRIEDTDRERSTVEAVDAIVAGMDWLRLTYDEGPFYQTDRMNRYQELIHQLLATQKAYRCYCSKERLEQLRAEQIANKQKPRYDAKCRHLPLDFNDRPFVVRFANPESGTVTFTDQIRGEISVQNSELDDLILARADGMPTYNFTVVVDDFDMRITHVIRGDDHINNTPRQINIFQALDATPPLYAHVPMILGADGKRLSKRHGAVSVLQYRDEGYLPEALLNYLVRLGWSYGDQEIFSVEEMIAHFSLKSMSRSPAIFNPAKLLWLNQYYLKTTPPESVANQLAWHFERMGVRTTLGPSLIDVVIAQRERVKTLVEMAEKSRFFFEDVDQYDEAAIAKEFSQETVEVLKCLLHDLLQLHQWDKEALHHAVHSVASRLNLKMGKVAQPIRIAVTGSTLSPPIDVTLALLGKVKTIIRLEKAIRYFL